MSEHRMDRIECDELCLALERNGASHVHTAGKAQMYLRALIGKPKAKFSNCTQEQFISAVRQALALGKWHELSDLMGGWW